MLGTCGCMARPFLEEGTQAVVVHDAAVVRDAGDAACGVFRCMHFALFVTCRQMVQSRIEELETLRSVLPLDHQWRHLLFWETCCCKAVLTFWQIVQGGVQHAFCLKIQICIPNPNPDPEKRDLRQHAHDRGQTHAHAAEGQKGPTVDAHMQPHAAHTQRQIKVTNRHWSLIRLNVQILSGSLAQSFD